MRHGDGHEQYPKEGLCRGKKEVYENRTNVADGLDKCYTADLWTAATKRWIIEQKQQLKSGLHPFRLYYTGVSGKKPVLDFQWSSSEISKQQIPSSVFMLDEKI